MSFVIEKDEATANRRRVPFRLFKSDGTSPETGASNGTVLGSLNGAAQLSLGSISVVSANAGQYYFELSQSNVSTLGSVALYTDTIATNFPQHVANVQVVNNNPMSFQSGVVIAGGSYSSTTVRIDLVQYSGASIGVHNITPGIYSGVSVSIRDGGIYTGSVQAGSYSGVSVEIKTGGIQTTSIGAGNYSGVSVEIKTRGIDTNSIRTASYSGVTFGIDNIAPNTYSGVSVGIKTGGIQTTSVGVGTYSGMTIQGILDPTEIWNASRSSYSSFGGFGAASQVVSVRTAQGGTFSTITLASFETTTDGFYNGCLLMLQYPDGSRAGAIISAYSGSARSALFINALPVAVPSNATYIIYPGVDASIGLSVWSSYLTRSLSAAGERSLASSIMSTDMGASRIFQQGWEPLRNRVQISGSTGTVFKTDDATSSWTFSVSTADFPLSGINPAGGA